MDKLSLKAKRLVRRKLRIKRKIRANKERPRLCISKSNTNFYAQIIDDHKGHTLVAMSTLSGEFPAMKNRGNIEAAKTLGEIFAKKAVSLGVTRVVFDRNGQLYHGKIKAFADAARENGLEF